jgi:hypothetical protein
MQSKRNEINELVKKVADKNMGEEVNGAKPGKENNEKRL